MPAINGSSTTPSRPLRPGVWAPIPTFFLPNSQDLDIPTLKKHVIHIAHANIGILLCGSMGEAHHLSPEERIIVITSAREALDSVGLTTTPIIAGTGAGSTRESIKLSKEAAQAGADYAIVIPSGYFAGAIANDRAALKTFFKEVSEGSPIPVMIYNYPGASGGIDMDSDLIEEMAMENPNICGVKLTCGNVGKLTRIAATVSIPSFEKEYPRKNKDAPFMVLGGFIDFLLPSLYANAHGAITGLANLYPYTIAALWAASNATLPTASGHSSDAAELLREAQQLQGVVARADRTIAVSGIAGTKWLMEKRYGYGGVCRRPLSPLSNSAGETLLAHRHAIDIERLEKEIEVQKGVERKQQHHGLKNGVTVSNGNGVVNGVSVSNETPSPPSGHSSASSTSHASSPRTPSDAHSPVVPPSPVTAAVKKGKGHSRSGSLTSSLRSLVGSRKGKKTTVE
ncbi:hypothetical protein FRC17_004063 [Serendipita sp. 399]|nr:hypothetical protein FRC17_004063 [Serendipita sp. 399]